MNILLLHQYFLGKNDAGGSRWNEMIRIWTEQGHQVTILAGMVHYTKGEKDDRFKGKYFYREKINDNVEILRCFTSESYNTGFLGRLWGYISFMLFSLFGGLFKVKGKYDVVIATSPPLFIGITGYLLSRFKRAPFTFEIRDLWPESAIDTGMLKNGFLIKLSYAVEAFLYKKAQLIVVLTPAFAEALIQRKNVPKEKIVLIPNACDFTIAEASLENFDRDAQREKMGISGKLAMIYVGAHGIANNLIQVVEVAEQLKNDDRAVFLLVGNGMEKPMLVAEAEKRGLANIRFYDSVPKQEIFRFIAAADLGMSVLKKVDTFKTVYSNKTFDYMSCRIPMLMLIDGVSRQLVEASGSGMYVEPENTPAFVDAVRFYLSQDGSFLRKQGESGYQFARKNFDRNILANFYLQNILKLAGKSGAEVALSKSGTLTN